MLGKRRAEDEAGDGDGGREAPPNPAAAMEAKRAQLRALAEAQAGALGLSSSGGGAAAAAAASSAEGGAVREVFGVPNSVAGVVIGRGGENIQALQARTGATVTIQSQSDAGPGAAERLMTISGAPGVVAEAKRIVMAIIQERSASGGGSVMLGAAGIMGGGGLGGGIGSGAGGGGATLHVQVPEDRVGAIIGRQGLTIKGIQVRA